MHDDPPDFAPAVPGPEAAAPRRARRSRLRRTLAVALAAIVLITGARYLRAATTSAAHDAVPGPGFGSVLPAGRRTVTPTLTGTTLTGTPFDVAALRGHVVVVNFWGSWCAPCRAEAPDLARLSVQTASQGVRFIGVDIRDDQAAALAFEREYAVPYPSVYDPDDSATAGFAPWAPVGTPTTYILDTHGRIAAIFSGRTFYGDLQPVLQQIVNLG